LISGGKRASTTSYTRHSVALLLRQIEEIGLVLTEAALYCVFNRTTCEYIVPLEAELPRKELISSRASKDACTFVTSKPYTVLDTRHTPESALMFPVPGVEVGVCAAMLAVDGLQRLHEVGSGVCISAGDLSPRKLAGQNR
jgi:hypothetical protein